MFKSRYIYFLLLLLLGIVFKVQSQEHVVPQDSERGESAALILDGEVHQATCSQPLSPSEKELRYILSNNDARPATIGWGDASEYTQDKCQRLLWLLLAMVVFYGVRKASSPFTHHPPQVRGVRYYVFALRHILI